MATLHMPLDFSVLKGPLDPQTPQYVRKPPPKGPQKPQTLCTLAVNNPKPKTDNILGYVAQNVISSAPNPPATTHFWWFQPLKIALTDTYIPVPRPSGLRQVASGSHFPPRTSFVVEVS